MIVTLETTDVDRRRLRLSVLGARVTARERGRGQKHAEHPSREDAIAWVEKSIARRCASGRWRLIGQTDSDRYLVAIETIRALMARVRKAPEVTVRDGHVMAGGPATFESLERHPGAMNPEYREFLLSATIIGLRLDLALGAAGQGLLFAFGAIGPRGEVGAVPPTDELGRVLVGRLNDRTWWMDPATGVVDTEGGRRYSGFAAFFDGELKELREYVYETGGALGVALSL